jgi:hypothetical protein
VLAVLPVMVGRGYPRDPEFSELDTAELPERRENRPFRGRHLQEAWTLRKGIDPKQACDTEKQWDGREVAAESWFRPKDRHQLGWDSIARALREARWNGRECNRGSWERSVRSDARLPQGDRLRCHSERGSSPGSVPFCGSPGCVEERGRNEQNEWELLRTRNQAKTAHGER